MLGGELRLICGWNHGGSPDPQKASRNPNQCLMYPPEPDTLIQPSAAALIW